jgi:hypothetical protein
VGRYKISVKLNFPPNQAVRNFSLSLYAFHLRQILIDAPDRVTIDAPLLWENLVKVGGLSLPFPGLKDLKSKLISYRNGKYEPTQEQGRQTDWLTDSGNLDLGSMPTAEGFKIKGNLQPFRLNDTYAAILTLSPESPDIPIEVPHLKHFHPSSLLPSSIQASLGQTLWLYGEVDAHDDCAALAQQCARALLEGTPFNPILLNQDEFFGSLLFEYQVTEPDEPQNLAKQTLILVSLNNSQAPTPPLAREANDLLLNLLCCRHKIFHVYHESCAHFPKARKLYSKLEQQIQDFENLIADSQTRLDNLKSVLAQMPKSSLDYTHCLRDLKAHHTVIKSSFTTYRICQEKVTAIGGSSKFWQDFLLTCDQWQSQIQTDIDYLSPGQNLFEQMLETVRGTVEIEQAECDRRLEKTLQDNESAAQEREQALEGWIAFVGTGLAVSGISSQVLSQPIETIINHKNPDEVCPNTTLSNCLLYSYLNVLIHIAVGVTAASFVASLIWLMSKLLNRSNK